MGKRALVVVRMIREFSYPKSMLHPITFIEDALRKARNDAQIVINEIVINDHAQLDVNMFEFIATEEPGYKFRKHQIEDEGIMDMVSLNKAAKMLTTQKMEAKYGLLNHEVNPNLYVHEEEVRNADGRIVRQDAWYMRADIENEYYEVYEQFREILRAVK